MKGPARAKVSVDTVVEATGVVDVSVLVISHGHEALLPACIGSLEGALEGLSHEILIVDNLPSGQMNAALRGLDVEVVSNVDPVGFAANVNAGARRCQGRHLLLLNPDTRHATGALAAAVAFLDRRSDVGVLACTLINEDGSRQQNFRQFPSLSFLVARGLGADRWPWRPAFYRERLMDSVAISRPSAVDWVFGAFMLMRRGVFDALGGMDEGYRLYYEDVDFCLRGRMAGLATYVFPDLVFYHLHRRESARNWFSATRRWHVRSALRYFIKSAGARPPQRGA